MKHSTYLLAIVMLLAACQQAQEGGETAQENTSQTSEQAIEELNRSIQLSKMIVNNFTDYIFRINEIVAVDYYNKQSMDQYETITFDSSGSSLLTANYHFVFYDPGEDYRMDIRHWIYVEESEEAAVKRAKLINVENWSRLNKHIKEKNFLTVNMDSSFNYGTESELTLINNQFAQLFGFYCFGRIGNVIATHSVLSNHMSHQDFESMLITATNHLQGDITTLRNPPKINE